MNTLELPEERELVDAVRSGDEAAFCELVDRYTPSMLRWAGTYVASARAAEDVVRDAWLGALAGLGALDDRPTLRVWLFRILTNLAKTRAERDGRRVPLAALWSPAEDAEAPSVGPERFRPTSDPDAPGHWLESPSSWEELAEPRFDTSELRGAVEDELDRLPLVQREVITLRDIEGWSPAEVHELLGLSETSQRLVLQRARSRIRVAIDAHLSRPREASRPAAGGLRRARGGDRARQP